MEIENKYFFDFGLTPNEMVIMVVFCGQGQNQECKESIIAKPHKHLQTLTIADLKYGFYCQDLF